MTDPDEFAVPPTRGRRGRILMPVGVLIALVIAWGWTVAHMRYVRPPDSIDHGREFAVSPRSVERPRGSTQPPAELAPRHLYVPAIGVHAPIVITPPTPAEPLPVPPPDLVGGFADGGRLFGESGTVLLAGHIVYNGITGVFSRLSQVGPGDDIWTTDGHNRAVHWRVHAMAAVSRNSPRWPIDVYDRRGERRLVLVTCTGTPVHVAGRGYTFPDNLFVYATPVRDEPAAADSAQPSERP